MWPDATVDWAKDDEHAEDCVPVWYVETGTTRSGPMSSLQLAFAAKHGLIARSSSIWREGLPGWVPIAEVAGLLPAEPARRHAAVRYSEHLDQRNNGASSFYDSFRASLSSRAANSGAGAFSNVGTDGAGPNRVTSAFETDLQSTRDAGLSDVPGRPGAVMRRAPAEGEGEALDRASIVLRAGLGGGHLVQSTQVTSLVVTEADEARTMTRRTADAIAMQIVIMLERHGINTLDDLASDDRLRWLAAAAFDALPGSLRLPITHTLGRSFVEQRIIDVLLTIRASIAPDTRAEDLRRITLEQAPVIASRIDVAMASAVGNVGSFVNSRWSNALGALRRNRQLQQAAQQLQQPREDA